MSTKYKIDDAKKNKNLINDEIKLSRIKSKNDHTDGAHTKKHKSTRKLLIEFMGEQREFNKSIMKKFDEQAKFNMRIEKLVSNLENDVSNLNNRFDNLLKVNNLNE